MAAFSLHLPRQRWLRRLLHRRLRPELTPDPRGRAIVFAPHQDDEVLGCGGTILQKTSAGTVVDLIFMTDGSTSHRRFIAAGKLAELRRAEALDAARMLGVGHDAVRFLNHPDGSLHTAHETAVAEIAELIDTLQPDELYVPYRNDGTADHETTFRVVRAGMERSSFAGRVFEYPVWFWNQWPWVAQSLRPNRTSLQSACRALRFGFGLMALREFRGGSSVALRTAVKREALAAHATQVIRPVDHPDWPILSDVSRGEFLEAMFEDHEVFRVTDAARFRLRDR